MFKTFVSAVVALALCAGPALAEDKADKTTKKAAKKGKALSGEIVKVDAEKGSFTVKVKAKKETKEVEVKVDEKTPVFAYNGKDKAELTGKDVLKKEAFKTGAAVSITYGEGDTVKEITFGKAAGKKKKEKADK